MYTEFYRLRALPFQLTPDPRFFFESAVHRKAEAHLLYGLSQGEGFIVITGDVGSGKTTLVGHLLSTLDAQRFVAARIVSTQLGADDMLRMVASTFNLAHDGDKATLLKRIEQFLVGNHRKGLRSLLLVDEAQNLTIPALEELRMLSNLQVGQQAPLQSFLLAQPQFRRTLARSDMEQLRQRVIASYHLGPLSVEDTGAYVLHRLRTVGWSRDPAITPEALVEVHRLTDGIPRRINTLCSRLLLYGYLEELHSLDAIDVVQVAEDLKREAEHVLDSDMPDLSDPEPEETKAVAEDSRAIAMLLDRIDQLESRLAEAQRERERERERRRGGDDDEGGPGGGLGALDSLRKRLDELEQRVVQPSVEAEVEPLPVFGLAPAAPQPPQPVEQHKAVEQHEPAEPFERAEPLRTEANPVVCPAVLPAADRSDEVVSPQPAIRVAAEPAPARPERRDLTPVAHPVTLQRRDGKPLNAMSVDVEDYFQVQALSGRIPREGWDEQERRVERNTNRILQLFDFYGVKATFFTLGWVAERYRRLIRQIVGEGHELACHGLDHTRIDRQTPDEFRADIRRAKALLEDAGGVPVLGYRAATFSLGARTLWAFDVLAEEGFAYSSSVYPVRHDLYGIPRAPRFAFRPEGSGLVELPMTTARFLGRNWPAAGGGWFRMLPYNWSSGALRRVNERDGNPCIFYFHPWELDPDQPRVSRLSFRARLRHYTNLDRMEDRLRRLVTDFAWDRLDRVFLEQRAA